MLLRRSPPGVALPRSLLTAPCTAATPHLRDRYAFSQPSLEQVFLEFAHTSDEVDEGKQDLVGPTAAVSRVGADQLVRDPTVVPPSAQLSHFDEKESVA